MSASSKNNSKTSIAQDLYEHVQDNRSTIVAIQRACIKDFVSVYKKLQLLGFLVTVTFLCNIVALTFVLLHLLEIV